MSKSITQELAEEADKADEYKAALQVVAQMRRFQRTYFSEKKRADLVESKRLETAVDLRLAELGIKAV